MTPVRSTRLPALAALLLLSACNDPAPTPADPTPAPLPAEPMTPPPAEPAPVAVSLEAQWEPLSSGEGDALRLATPDAPAIVHLFCAAGSERLLVNVPAFRAIASEDRMSLGAGTTVVALVADPAGDALRGGVSADGPLPSDLPAILGQAGGMSVSYGAQTSGPYPPVPADQAERFVLACRD